MVYIDIKKYFLEYKVEEYIYIDNHEILKKIESNLNVKLFSKLKLTIYIS